MNPRALKSAASRFPSLAHALLLLLSGGIVLLLAPPSAQAQQTGAVSGQVLQAGTGSALSGVQMSVRGTQIGTLTSADGEFTIRGVPPGEHTIVAQLIGYQTATRRVEVEAGQTATVDFQLSQTALQMEELVVTGAGVTQQKKELGQTVATVSTEELDQAPVTDVQSALDGRVAGAIINSAGETGQSAQIRLRGTISLSQRNSPLLYVDGVRIPNSRNNLSSVTTSTLNDLNPENIERIEVLKGAAAATLYGSEASAGVIQIFTKSGVNSEPQFNLSITQQGIQMPGAGQIPADRIPDNTVYNPETGQLENIEPERFFLRTGHRQEYQLAVRGGGNEAQYYGSVWWKNEKGPMPTNSLRNSGLRTNIDFSVTDQLRAQTTVSFTDNKVQAPSPSWGLMGEATLASPLVAAAQPEERPYGGLFFSVPGAIAFQNTQERGRVTGTGKLTYQWSSNLTSAATFGYTGTELQETSFVERGSSIVSPTGERFVQNAHTGVVTVDFNTAWEARFSESLSSTFTVGGQGYWQEEEEQSVGVRDYPAPGLKTLRGASTVTTVDESAVEKITAGLFAQEKLGLNDRMFLTVGTRLDQSSAFGDAFNVEAYPKAGFSWVISEEPFWETSWLDHLRLRAAWGTSGLQPGAYDALRTWRAVTGGENQAGVRPQSVGNENLKPERSTEREIGAELGMFDDRLTLDVTGYYQTTQDAILQRRLPASTGFLSPQFVNIGELTSKGLESTMTAQIIQGSDFQLSINGTFSWRSSEVSNLADVAEYRVSYNANRWNWVKEGYEPAAVIGPTIDPNDPYRLGVPIEEFDDLTQLSPNTLKTAAGSDSMVFHGHNLPTKTFTLSPTLDLPDDNLTIRMMWKAETGFVMFDQTNQIRANTGITPRVAGWTQELKNPSTSTERRREIADAWANIHPNIQTLWVQDADYLKLQEFSVAWSLPSGFLNATGLDNARLTFSGRHLLLFTKYGGMTDPGTTNTRAQAADLIQNVDYYSAPIPPRVGVELNLGF